MFLFSFLNRKSEVELCLSHKVVGQVDSLGFSKLPCGFRHVKQPERYQESPSKSQFVECQLTSYPFGKVIQALHPHQQETLTLTRPL